MVSASISCHLAQNNVQMATQWQSVMRDPGRIYGLDC